MDINFLTDSDIQECNEFHNNAYGTNRSLAQWHWQFDGMLGGIRPFVVAKEDGRIVGTQALMPIIMSNAVGDFLTAKSEETLVDSSMRGKGVFQKMYEPLMALALSHGVKAIWGFTPASKAFEGVGFSVPDSTSQLVFPLSIRASTTFLDSFCSGPRRFAMNAGIGVASILSASRLAATSRKDKGIRLEVIDDPPITAGALSREFVRSWGGVTILRDQSYLKWRYFDNPVVRATLLAAYRGNSLVGWLAYALDKNSMGYIVDAIVPRYKDSFAILHSLMLKAVLALRSSGAVAIRNWHLNRHPFDRLNLEVSRSLGFYLVRRGEPVVLYLPRDLAPHDSLADWNGWFVTRAYTQGEAG